MKTLLNILGVCIFLTIPGGLIYAFGFYIFVLMMIATLICTWGICHTFELVYDFATREKK